MKTIGLCGGMASGKSTVARCLADTGAAILDCDTIAKELVDPGRIGWSRVLSRFGIDYATPEGGIDRRILGSAVFNDPDKLSDLNGLLHPLLFARVASLLSAEAPGKVCVIDAAVLVESGLWRLCDHVCLVVADKETQVSRLMRRNSLTRGEALARLAAQMDTRYLRGFADHVIDTTDGIDSVRVQVAELTTRWGITEESS